MWYLFLGTFRRSFAEMKRYFANTLSSLISMMIIFVLIVLGFRTFGPGTGDTLRATAVGYFTWISLLMSMTSLSWTVMNEIQRGMIEQEFLSPYGPLAVFMMYQISEMILSLPLLYLMMIAIFSLAGLSVSVNPVFFIFLILMLIQSIGISFILAGITLRYKRTNALIQLVQFAVIGLLFLRVNGLESIFVPISLHFQILNGIVNGDIPGISQTLSVLIGTVLWFTIGSAIFTIFEKNVRKNGILGVY